MWNHICADFGLWGWPGAYDNKIHALDQLSILEGAAGRPTGSFLYILNSPDVASPGGYSKNNSHSPDLARQATDLRVCFSLFFVYQRNKQLILDSQRTNQLILILAEQKAGYFVSRTNKSAYFGSGREKISLF